MSLLPEKPLVFSPQLAATLGLEEAVLFQALSEVRCHQSGVSPHWIELNGDYLARLLPFWQESDVLRIALNLQHQGVLLTEKPQASDGVLRFALKDKLSQQARTRRSKNVAPGSKQMSQSWQPENDVITQLTQYGIPRAFIDTQVPEFITYWSERGEPHYSWGSKFLKQVVRLWREQQNREARQQGESPMSSDWRPSPDAIDILTGQAGISPNFVEDAIPEFILYWQDKGTRSSTWNSQFIHHVRKQWVRYTSTIEHQSDPRPIAADWQPGEDLFEVLKLANIPRTFAEQQLPGFVLYWRETGSPHNSWNTKFLQYIKRQWAYGQSNQMEPDNGKQQRPHRAVSTRNTSLVEDLTDRSWAS